MTALAKELTDNDVANLEKIAALRGYAGTLRAQIVMARNLLLRNEHVQPPSKLERDALTILSRALEAEAP